MNWLLFAEVAYLIVLFAVALRVVYDSTNVTKTLAYLLLILFIPFFGMLIYFGIGINYRKRKIYSKKLIEDDELARSLEQHMIRMTHAAVKEGEEELEHNASLAYLLLNENLSPLTSDNHVRILVNGEEKFEALLKDLNAAKDHIHIEYYIFEEEGVGSEIGRILKEKAAQGVKVRFIYDAFGSLGMSAAFENDLRSAGVEIYPFFKIYFPLLANRLNYRNHRKIVVIDGEVGYTGGINVSDRYINSHDGKGDPGKRYWRDTHVRIQGPGVQYLQYLFFCDWNFCADVKLPPDPRYFPGYDRPPGTDGTMVQIVASGPDSRYPSILFSVLKAISLARKEILITTPYLIPGESLLNTLVIAAYSGVRIRVMVPGKSDSKVVQAAARSYYRELLDAGVEIYEYEKGFIHAKTMVIDQEVAMIGTANMDIRSFDLNFEVNAVIYDKKTARDLKYCFLQDIKHAREIKLEEWKKRPVLTKLVEKTAGLSSPLL